MSHLVALLKEDETFLRFIRVRNTAISSINVRNLLQEAEYLHASRKSRKLSSAKLSPNTVHEAVINDSSNRSRLVELRSMIMKAQELLVTAMSAARRYVRVKYSEEFKDAAKTQAERNALLDKLFTKAITFKDELEYALDVLDLYIKDIDQTAHALHKVVELLKLHLDRRTTEI